MATSKLFVCFDVRFSFLMCFTYEPNYKLMYHIDQIVFLLKRYLIGKAHAKTSTIDVSNLLDEYPQLEELLGEFANEEQLLRAVEEYRLVTHNEMSETEDPVLQKILCRIRNVPEKRSFFLFRKSSYLVAGVAACAILFAVGLVVQKSWKKQPFKDHMELAEEFLPGKNGAVLSLSDGTSVALRTDQKSIIVQEGLSYSDGTPLLNEKQMEGNVMMKLTVPRGSEYRVVLPDGTKVWLNAESELTYPRVFAGDKRRVQLSGEAYFEVLRNEKMPFVVKTTHESVEVLGTHFNVNAYKKEQISTVSLIEGKVKVSLDGKSAHVLKPGQQSQVSGNQMKIEEINIEESVAWKNGEFMFNDESLKSAMSKVARWYDLEIEVEPALDSITLWGSLPRNEDFSKVLKMIKLVNRDVKVAIDGRRVRLMK